MRSVSRDIIYLSDAAKIPKHRTSVLKTFLTHVKGPKLLGWTLINGCATNIDRVSVSCL